MDAITHNGRQNSNEWEYDTSRKVLHTILLIIHTKVVAYLVTFFPRIVRRRGFIPGIYFRGKRHAYAMYPQVSLLTPRLSERERGKQPPWHFDCSIRSSQKVSFVTKNAPHFSPLGGKTINTRIDRLRKNSNRWRMGISQSKICAERIGTKNLDTIPKLPNRCHQAIKLLANRTKKIPKMTQHQIACCGEICTSQQTPGKAACDQLTTIQDLASGGKKCYETQIWTLLQRAWKRYHLATTEGQYLIPQPRAMPMRRRVPVVESPSIMTDPRRKILSTTHHESTRTRKRLCSRKIVWDWMGPHHPMIDWITSSSLNLGTEPEEG